MKFNFSPEESTTAPSPDSVGLGIGGTLADIGLAIPRGILGGVEGVYDLLDFATFDILPDAEDNFGAGHSETLAGGLVEGISQFVLGFIPGMAVASKLGKVTKISKAISAASNAARAAGKTSKAAAIKWGAEFGKAAVAGGIADLTVFDAHEERLSNLLQAYPSLQNPVSEFLAADENDGELEGRFKNFIEGSILGVMTEPFVLSLKALRKARKSRLDGQDPDEAIASVMDRRNTQLEMPFEGEYWLKDGRAEYADGDFGDFNHEALVIADVANDIGDDLASAVGRDDVIGGEYDPEIIGELLADANKAAKESGQTLDVWLKSKGFDPEAVRVASGDSAVDARDYGMRVLGQVRMAGNSIQLYGLNRGRLEEIARGIGDAAETDRGLFDADQIMRETFDIEDSATGKFYTGVPYSVIEGGDMKALRDYEYRRSQLEYPRSDEGRLAFSEWFKESVARTEDGRPLTLVHETNARFDTFEAGEFGFHLGQDIPGGMFGSRRMTVHVSMQNPVRINDVGVFTPLSVFDALPLNVRRQISGGDMAAYRDRLVTVTEELQARQAEIDANWRNYDDQGTYERGRLSYEAGAGLREDLKKAGYDGLIYRNDAEGFKDSFVAFDSAQIKSTRAERYDPRDPNVRHTPGDLIVDRIDSDDAIVPDIARSPRGERIPNAEIRRGAEAVKGRIEQEMSRGRLSRESGERMVAIVNKLDRHGWLDTLGLRFRKMMEARGLYDLIDDVITISNRMVADDEMPRVFAHELWHAMTRRLGVGDLQAVSRDFAKQQAKFLKKHGLTVGEDISMSGGFTQAGRKKIAEKQIPFDEWYRMSSLDEWIAESMADSTLKRLDLEAGTETLLGLARYLAHEVLTIVKSTVGAARYDRITREMFAGRYKDASLKIMNVGGTATKIAKTGGGMFRGAAGSQRAERGPISAYMFSKTSRPYFMDEGGYIIPSEAPKYTRRYLAMEADEPMPFPPGARTPREGTVFNLNFFSDTEGVDKWLASQTNTASEAYQQELMQLRSMSLEDVRGMGSQRARELRDHGFNAFDPDDLASLGVTDQIVDVVAKQNVARNLLQQYTKLVDDLAAKAVAGGDREKVEFILARKRSQDLALVVKRNQEKIAQALSAQKAVGTDTPLPTNRVLPPDLSTVDEPRFFQDVLEELGGGDAAAGRDLVQRQITEYQNAVAVNGQAGGFRVAQERAKFHHMFIEYWMNSILSGPVTHMVNMTSNMITTFYLPFEKALGQAMTLQFSEAGTTMRHYAYLMQHMNDAFSAAQTAFKKEADPLDAVSKLETNRSNRAISSANTRFSQDSVAGQAVDWIGKALNLPSRFLMAEDAFFKNLNYRASVKSQLTEEAMRNTQLVKNGPRAIANFVETEFEKIIGDGQFYSYKNMRQKAEAAAKERIGSDLSDPVDRQRFSRYVNAYMKRYWNEDNGALAKKALGYARETTFTQPLEQPGRHGLIKMSAGMQRVVNQTPVLRFILPFIRTPTNLIAFYLDRVAQAPMQLARLGIDTTGSRLGLLNKEVGEQMLRGGRTKADLVGRTSAGAMLTMAGVMAYMNGYLSGGGPADPETRRTWEATGWQPYSIRLGDEWVSYRRFDPFASFFGSVADLMESMNQATTEEEKAGFETLMGALIFSAARNITNKSYLTGMTRVANVLNDPSRYASSYWEQTAASFLPYSGAAGQTIGADEYQREIRTTLDAMRAKYGMTSQGVFEGQVAPRRNMLGEPLERSKPWPWYGSPMAYTDIKDDEIMAELSRVGHGFGPPRTLRNGLDLTTYRNEQGQNFHDRWSQLHGEVRVKGKTIRQAMQQLIRSGRYQRMPVEAFNELESPRVAEIRKLISQFRTKALSQALREFPEVRDLDFRMTRIKTLRREGRDISSILEF